jgi:hypothetical protein
MSESIPLLLIIYSIERNTADRSLQSINDLELQKEANLRNQNLMKSSWDTSSDPYSPLMLIPPFSLTSF